MKVLSLESIGAALAGFGSGGLQRFMSALERTAETLSRSHEAR
jgi:hypothetical protein